MDKHFDNELSQEVYNITYRYGEETIEDTFRRVADNLASIETDKEYWSEQFFNLMNGFSFIPGGRILSNAGIGLKGTTYINCFVDGFIGEDQDSMESIMDTLKRQALILKSEGGYGFCADVMRPRGAFINGIANESPGAVKMLEMWDKQSEIITLGSDKKSERKDAKQKIRKGAQSVTMSVWHADIENFILAKQNPNILTKFNMSVLITDEFMYAVKNHLPWKLEFPDIDSKDLIYRSDNKLTSLSIKDKYKEIWDGNIKKWKELNLPVKIYKEYKDANELWDLIMKSTYNRNEPGVVFIDTVNKLNNLYYCEHISAANPCFEIPMPIGGVCLLGNINLTKYIKDNNWDYEKLKKDIPFIIRFMDNVNDITSVPLQIQKENLKNKRRIGMGIMGYASALIIMGFKYGSKNALKITNELMEFIANTAYSSSSLLAKEKGTFKLYDEKKYLQSEYIQKLSKETISLIKQNGLRNSHLLTIAPTGNTSAFANNVSGGLEPVFMFKYKRTFMIPYSPEGLQVPVFINGNLHSKDWKIEKEGDENIYTIEFNGKKYKYDKNRGLTKEADVIDYGVKFRMDNNIWNDKEDYAVNTNSLNINEHVNTMEIFAKWIDNSISKTINLPNEYSYENFKDVYFKLWETKTIKGGTTYRAGTMMSVLSDENTSSLNFRNGNHISKTHAPKRPKTLKCDVHFVTAKGEQWIVFIGLLDKDPYEVFALKEKHIHLPKRITEGSLTKIKSGFYNFETEDGFLIEDITNLFERAEEEALTRMLSWGLRHGAGIEYAIDGLNKSEGTVVSFAKAISRTLKKYVKTLDLKETTCPECGEESLIYQEGCVKCTNCTYSKC
jgi:ribonucleoside-diphosphate reductase alpha chain